MSCMKQTPSCCKSYSTSTKLSIMIITIVNKTVMAVNHLSRRTLQSPKPHDTKITLEHQSPDSFSWNLYMCLCVKVSQKLGPRTQLPVSHQFLFPLQARVWILHGVEQAGASMKSCRDKKGVPCSRRGNVGAYGPLWKHP